MRQRSNITENLKLAKNSRKAHVMIKFFCLAFGLWHFSLIHASEAPLPSDQRACKIVLASGIATPKDRIKLFFSEVPTHISKLYRGILVEGNTLTKEDIPAVQEYAQNVLFDLNPERREIVYDVLNWPSELREAANLALKQKEESFAGWKESARSDLAKILRGTLLVAGAGATAVGSGMYGLDRYQSGIEEEENKKNFFPFYYENAEVDLFEKLKISDGLSELPHTFNFRGQKYKRKNMSSLVTGGKAAHYELTEGDSPVKQIEIVEDKVKNVANGFSLRLISNRGVSRNITVNKYHQVEASHNFSTSEQVSPETFIGILGSDSKDYSSLVPKFAARTERKKTPFDEKYKAHIKLESSGVAVVDSGIDYSRSDLMSAAMFNDKEIPFDKIDNDNNGYTDDYLGYDFKLNSPVTHSWPLNYHGSMVSEVVSKGSQRVRVMPIKVHTELPSGLSALKNSIEYIKKWNQNNPQKPIRAVNISIGSGSPLEPEIIQAIRDNPSIFFIASAGNNMQGLNGKHSYPAELPLPNVFNIGAVNSDGELSFFSGSGPNVDMVELGSNVELKDAKGNKIKAHGTSFSAPAIATLIAEAVLLKPDITAQQLRKAFETSLSNYVRNEETEFPMEGLSFQAPTRGKIIKEKFYENILSLK